jgi:hypothetical protein
MLFVPYVPHERPSPRAEELGKRLAETIDAYCREHPDLSGEEIRQAAHLATASKAGQNPAVAVAVVAVFILAGVLAALVAKGHLGFDEQFLLPGIVLLVVILVVGVLFFLKSR